MSLRKQAFAGVRWTTVSSLGRSLVQVLQVIVLARLLSPHDFGLMAIVVSIMVFLSVFSDLGVSNAIIHQQFITPSQLSSLYWLNVGVSSALAVVVAGASPLIAAAYEQPPLQPLLMFAALTLAIGALAQQIRIVEQKHLRFSGLAKVDLTAALVGFIAAVSVALLGGGVFALIAGALTSATTATVLLWLTLSRGWRPQRHLNLREIREYLAFGAYMIANNLANTFNAQVDIMLGAHLVGAQAIGLYSVPKDLSLRIAGVINPIVTQVGLPLMAKAQGDTALLKRVYLQTMRMTASVNFPAYVAVSVFARELVVVALGQRWSGSVPLLQILAWWALLRSTINPVGSLLLAVGRADLSFKWNIAWLAIIPPAVWVGSFFGVKGVAFAMLAGGIAVFVPHWRYLVLPLCGARLGELCAQLAVPLVLSLAAGLAGHSASTLASDGFVRLVLGFIAGGVTYVTLSYVFNRSWYSAMIELVGIRPTAGR